MKIANKIYYLASSLGFRCYKSQLTYIKVLIFWFVLWCIYLWEIENIPTKNTKKKFIRKTKFSRNHCVSGIKLLLMGLVNIMDFP